jgi:hypothetical protein
VRKRRPNVGGERERSDAMIVFIGTVLFRMADDHDRCEALRQRASVSLAIAAGASSGIAKHELTLTSHRI